MRACELRDFQGSFPCWFHELRTRQRIPADDEPEERAVGVGLTSLTSDSGRDVTISEPMERLILKDRHLFSPRDCLGWKCVYPAGTAHGKAE